MAYRPPGRHNRSGRITADNDVFEGLPVKQWGHLTTHVSLTPPKEEEEPQEDDLWADPPMPRDYSSLQPWTQYILHVARCGKVGSKRKQHPEPQEEEKQDEAAPEAEAKEPSEERGYYAKRWKPVPEASLEPEHKHLEFLAKRRKGLPILYGPDAMNPSVVPMRKTMVQRTDATGEVAVYEVLLPEGQSMAGEVQTIAELADVKPVTAAPGTVVEGVGVANDDGVLVAEHLKPSMALRRNRPPPKKKGGPGRGKKRVTFTNADGSTYTTVVPNATKIVPQPGQTVKHVAKGEEAMADVAASDIVRNTAPNTADRAEGYDQDDEDGDDDGDEEGDEDDDDDREEGEVTEDEATATETNKEAEPQPEVKKVTDEAVSSIPEPALKDEDVLAPETPAVAPTVEPVPAPELRVVAEPPLPAAVIALSSAAAIHDPSTSPDLPLAQGQHSRKTSLAAERPIIATEPVEPVSKHEEKMVMESARSAFIEADIAMPDAPVKDQGLEEAQALRFPLEPAAVTPESHQESVKYEEDLLGSLQRSLGAREVRIKLEPTGDTPNAEQGAQTPASDVKAEDSSA